MENSTGKIQPLVGIASDQSGAGQALGTNDDHQPHEGGDDNQQRGVQ